MCSLNGKNCGYCITLIQNTITGAWTIQSPTIQRASLTVITHSEASRSLLPTPEALL